MKLEGRRSSRLHLEFDPVTEVCRCGCGLAYMDAWRRNREIRFLYNPEALMEKGKVTPKEQE